VVLRLLRELRNHPRAIERSTPALVHLMHHGEGHVAVTAAKLLGSLKCVRDAVAIPVLALGGSGVARNQRVASAFEEMLRGDEVFDLEIYRSPLNGFLASAPEKQAALVYQARERDWRASETGRAVVFGALASGTPYVQRLALETLLTLDYSAISEHVRLPIEVLLGFTARTLVSDGSPRINRDLFMRTASNLEHSAELAIIFLESAERVIDLAHGIDPSPEVPAKLYYGAAALLRGESSGDGFQDAMRGLGGFLALHDPKVLGRITRRLVNLSAELPEVAGEQAVDLLLGALRDRAVADVPNQERQVLIRAVQEVSGYDTVIVNFCARLLAECGGPIVERVITEVLGDRLGRMLEDGATDKANAILNYIEGRRPRRLQSDYQAPS